MAKTCFAMDESISSSKTIVMYAIIAATDEKKVINYVLLAIEVKVLRKIYFKEVYSFLKISKACLYSLAQAWLNWVHNRASLRFILAFLCRNSSMR